MEMFIKPDRIFYDSFVSTINESKLIGEGAELNYVTDDFDVLCKEVLNNWEKEEYYWMVENNDFLGDIIIRKRLLPEELLIGGHISYFVASNKRNNGYGKVLLEYGIKKAKELGIKNIILTCYEDNIYSRKIIEKFGGVVVHRIFLEKLDKVLLRYALNNITK